MGDLYNQMTGAMDDKPLSEKQPPGQFDLAVEESGSIDSGRAARVLKAGQTTGLPSDIVDEHLDDIEKRMVADDFDAERFREESPTVAQWMAESPLHAAVIRDERQSWGALERFTNAVSESWKNEWDMHERAALLRREMQGETLSPAEAARRDKLAGDMLHRARQNQTETNAEYVARTNTAGVYQMGQSMKEQIKGAATAGAALGVVGFATAGPPGAAAGVTFGVVGGGAMSGGAYSYNQEAPMLFDDLRNMTDINGNKMDIETARNVARATGVLLATVETASGAAVASMIPGVKNVVARGLGVDAAKQAIKNQVKLAMMNPTTAAAVKTALVGFAAAPTTEAAEEFVQALISAGGREVAQAASGQTFAPDDFGKDVEGALQQGKDAFVGSLFVMGAPVAGSRLHAGLRDVKIARQNEAYFKALSDTVNASKMREAIPEKMREVVERVTENGPVQDVYIDSTQWRTYFQNKGIDPKEAARQVWGNTEEYDRAEAADSSMRLPIADYATKIATTEHNGFFEKELRYNDPNSMNIRETEQVEKDIEQMIKDQADPMRSVKEEVSSRLRSIGYEQSTADTMATQMHEFFTTQAKNLGVTDPMALFERYGVDIQRGENAAPAADSVTYNQGTLKLMPTSVLAGMRDVDRNVTPKSDAEMASITASINKDGIKNPVVITISTADNMAYVTDGNTRVTVAQNLGINSVPVVFEKTDIPFTPEQKAKAKPLGETGINLVEIPDRSLSAQEQADREEMRALLAKTFYQKEKGSITIGPNKKMNIKIMEDGDLSTFLHESGHLYLEVLRDLSSPSGWETLKKFLGQELEDGPRRAQMMEDAQKIAEWLGAENLDNLTVEQHEQFARGVEAYLMEGKAPSVALRSAFARFRAWLVALYRTITNLNVKLNPEIRGVMDRMFATQEAIDAANKEAQVSEIFTTAEEAGMSDTEFAAYKKLLVDVSARAQDELQHKVLRQMQREQEAEWKRRRTEIRNQIAAHLEQQPEYKLLDFLSSDENKLSRDAVYAMYPGAYKDNQVLQALHRIDAYRSAEGLDPNLVAEANGFSSADEMVRTLISTTPFNKAVEEQTDIRMKELYGDILVDGTLADEAKKFVMGPGRSDVLMVELKALRKRQREAQPVVSAVVRAQRATRAAGMASLQTGVPSLSFVRQIAQDTIAKMRIRHINPQTHLVAARHASKAALAAVHKGDYHIAAYHKQKELLNTELYREAVRAKDEVEKITKFMRTFEDSAVRERLGRAGDFYLEQIDAILERFDFSRITTKDAAKRKSLVQWIEQQKKAGVQVNIPEEIQNEAYRMPWKEMSFDELVGVSDAAKHIKHLAVLKNKLLKSKAGRELSATVTLLEETMTINARHKDSRQRETRLPQDMAAHSVGGFFAAHRKIASLAREMDGMKDGGPVWESIIWPLNEAAASEAMMHEKSNIILRDLFKPYITMEEKAKTLATSVTLGQYSSGIYKKEFIPEINDSLSKVGRLMVALNWGNESNRQRIMEGYHWTTQQVEAILAPLTKEDWDFVQGVIDHFESYWPEVEALAKRVDGVAPKKVQAAAILTPHGEYRGGYFPLKYDDRQSPKAYSHLAKEAADRAMNGAAIRASTAHGERINRVANVKMPVRLDFGVITEALNETIHDISHYETLIDLNRVIGNGRVQSTMIAHFGHEALQQFRSALEDVAGGDIPAQTHVDKSLNWLRKGTTIASMGWNLVTAAMQPLGFTQSIQRIGAKWVGKGIGRWVGGAVRMENTVKWVHDKSNIMQERSVTQSREINEIRNIVSPGGLLSPVQDSFFYFIVKMQQVVDIPTWLGAYEKGMEEFAGDEAKAIALADQAVLDSQGGGQIKDMAAVQRGGPAQKLWTNFYSYFNTTFNLTAESYRGTDFKNPYAVGRFAADMLLLYTIPAVLSMFIRDGLKGDVEDDPDKLMKKLVQAQMSYMVGPVLLAREVGGTLQGYYGYEGPAGARFFAQLAKLGRQVEQGEADAAALKAVNNTAGVLFHYPSGQVQKIVEGVAYNAEHGTANPLPVLVGPPKE